MSNLLHNAVASALAIFDAESTQMIHKIQLPLVLKSLINNVAIEQNDDTVNIHLKHKDLRLWLVNFVASAFNEIMMMVSWILTTSPTQL